MINPTQQIWRPLPAPELDWRDNVPVSRATGDIYFSTNDGRAESDYVFLQGNHLRERWQGLEEGSPFTLGEIGVGTGLNLCLTLAEWIRLRPAGASLRYIGIEQAPLPPTLMNRALSHWPELASVAQALLPRWPDPLPGCHRRIFADWGVTLDLWWGDAGEALTDLASHGQAWVDAWFLDGFSPAREPGPWCETVYAGMASLSRSGATFATFTAAGDVKRGLTAKGFDVTMRPGFGDKRDALAGVLAARRPLPPSLTPWDLNPNPGTTDPVCVVGAGLAGAHIAHALAHRGIPVTVLEAHRVAEGGSSNLQGITYTRLSHRHNPLTDFSLAAFSFATDHYRGLMDNGALSPERDGSLGGYIQLQEVDETLNHLAEALMDAPDFAAVLDAPQIAAMIGLEPRCGGVHYRRGGWLDPRAVCRALLAHPLITVKEQCGPVTLAQTNAGTWQGKDGEGRTLTETSIAVLATAAGVRSHQGLDWLPLATIRGQTTHVASPPALSQLGIALCDKGYLPPAREGMHCLGASFGPGDIRTDERAAEHAHNIDMMHRALPSLTLTAPDTEWQGHVALRCNSNDYLPVVGMAPKLAAFNQRYETLRHDRKRMINVPAAILPGLAILSSLGSRGLTAAPLAAQMLADHLLGAPPATPRYLQRAVSPARFAERALKRGEPL
ncbi:MAG: bifunctional tRNA (5-methylaminomethyl-2-thiouridine)(34)-methyltransferase MnmD/FAD-dependent 5-carboxymethylaminomethyl-2-thiouridine(34) oxidoreductase MnmC [Luminiphilus sp.]|nr:bifunctional tRNA (5-methylaminomethyl-2-thiouridine)(34)-methyltransferase MnmD/FAD-dependent 5-carboxymethylaminomethyl-2-thiouridine(34) oxidoreductase MnmC [Luminiphilus sp.]